MRPIVNDKVFFENNQWYADCVCSHRIFFTTKARALNMLKRKSCRHCKKDYRSVKDYEENIYKRGDGKWCSICSGCNQEQAYTRKDHARQSSVSDWQCKKCVAKAKGFSKNKSVGDFQRMFNKFKKSADSRNIFWGLTILDLKEIYTGKCALSGWNINMSYINETASLDRIDNKQGYTKSNVQWVHSMVNMCKNKYDESVFIKMCIDIAKKRTSLN